MGRTLWSNQAFEEICEMGVELYPKFAIRGSYKPVIEKEGVKMASVVSYVAERKFEYVAGSVAQKVLKRDCHRCICCGRHVFLKHDWGKPFASFHAVIPRSEGGRHEVGNVVTLCKECHNHIEGLGLNSREEIRIWGLRYIEDDNPVQRMGFLSYSEIANLQSSIGLPNDVHPLGDWHAWVYGGYRRPNEIEREAIRIFRNTTQKTKKTTRNN